MNRVSFEEATSDGMLLGGFFSQLSWPQKVTLKALYGQPLDDTKRNPKTGLTEMDYWALIQGSAEYDQLGYPTKIIRIPYVPKEYNQLWAIVGRRAGKTSQLQSFIIAYEAALGGHEEYIKQGQECVIYLIAQKLDIARANIPFVTGILKSSPVLEREIVQETVERVRLRNGISIMPSPPSLKAQRGLACPVVAMDEVAFWYSDPDSANPDFEVERAVRYSQLQFPNYKRIGISTPWTKEGLLWKYHRAGTEGGKLPDYAKDKQTYKGVLTVFAPTATFENPLITRERLMEVHQEDEEAYQRESLCKFYDSISGFLARHLIEIAAEKGKGYAQRRAVKDEDHTKAGGTRPNYVAAMDPAFRHDNFAFCICHRDEHGHIVVDVLKKWTPERGQKLNPKVVLGEIAIYAKEYGILSIYTDQYQLESLNELAMDIGLSLDGVDFTNRSKARIYGNLQQLVNQQKLTLLDPDLNEDAKTTMNELIWLERRLTDGGNVQIKAPDGKTDDLATVVALATYQSVWMMPDTIAEDVRFKEPTLFERGMATIQKRQRLDESGWF